MDNTLSYEMLKQISQELFCHEIDSKRKKAPSDYQCPQYNYLVINEMANVIICCQTPSDNDYICGNLMVDNLSDIIAQRMNSEICKKCLLSGLAFYLNTSLSLPTLYSRSFKQKLLTIKTGIRRRLNHPEILWQKFFNHTHKS